MGKEDLFTLVIIAIEFLRVFQLKKQIIRIPFRRHRHHGNDYCYQN
jgi:hypothetical protein